MTTLVLALVASTTTAIGLEVRALDIDAAARNTLIDPITTELRGRGLIIEEGCAACARKIDLFLIGGITRASIELRFEGRFSTVEVPLETSARAPDWPRELVDELLGTEAQLVMRAEPRLRPIAWGFLGATIAASATALIAGAFALDAELDLRSEPHFDDAIEPIEGRLQISRTISLVSLGVGVLTLGTVALLTWLD